MEASVEPTSTARASASWSLGVDGVERCAELGAFVLVVPATIRL